MQHAHNVDENPDNGFEPCDHVNWLGICGHCAMYCARCCMKVIKKGGCHQDDFRNYDGKRQTTVEENHGVPFNAVWASKYGFKQLWKRNGNVPYDKVYKKILETKKSLVNFESHSCVVSAIRHNLEGGTITRVQSFYWDPHNAKSEWKPFGGDLYLYLVK